MSLKVGIVGAAGYAGAELIRLVLGHPEFELVAITSIHLIQLTRRGGPAAVRGVSELCWRERSGFHHA